VSPAALYASPPLLTPQHPKGSAPPLPAPGHPRDRAACQGRWGGGGGSPGTPHLPQRYPPPHSLPTTLRGVSGLKGPYNPGWLRIGRTSTPGDGGFQEAARPRRSTGAPTPSPPHPPPSGSAPFWRSSPSSTTSPKLAIQASDLKPIPPTFWNKCRSLFVIRLTPVDSDLRNKAEQRNQPPCQRCQGWGRKECRHIGLYEGNSVGNFKPSNPPKIDFFRVTHEGASLRGMRDD